MKLISGKLYKLHPNKFTSVALFKSPKIHFGNYLCAITTIETVIFLKQIIVDNIVYYKIICRNFIGWLMQWYVSLEDILEQ